jgi:menaquinone-dependent protoporphyrinogen oxidase
MQVLVVYASSFGATRGIAERIADTLRRRGIEVDLHSADESGVAAAPGYSAYIVGSAIHGGRWLPAAQEFVARNESVLAARPTWLFSSGPIGERYVHVEQPDPKDVARFRRTIRPRDHVVFAGAFDPATADMSRLGWLERNVAGRLMPQGDYRDWPAIEAWANGIAQELTAAALLGG